MSLAKAHTEHIGLTPCNAEAAARPKIIEAKVEQFRSVHRPRHRSDQTGVLRTAKVRGSAPCQQAPADRLICEGGFVDSDRCATEQPARQRTRKKAAERL